MKHKKRNVAAVVLFVGCLMFFCVGSLFMPDRKRSVLEARKLTRHIKYTSLEQYLERDLFQNIENYVSDQMIGRDCMEGLYGDILRLTGHRNINDRIILKDNQIVEIYQTVPNYQSYIKKIDRINQFYEKNKIPFLMVNTPVKASIVAENETWQGKPISNRETVVNQYFAELKEKGVDTLDVTAVLKELYQKGQEPYYATDHHWNYKGVYAAYQELVKKLRIDGLSIPVLSEDDFEIYTDSHAFYGSGIRTIGGTVLFNRQHDQVSVRYPKYGNYELERYGKDALEGKGSIFVDTTIYQGNEEKYFDYYNIHLGGNQRKAVIRNKELSDGKVLVFVGDSFSLSMLPLLAANFKEIHYFDARHLNEPITEYAKEAGADQVIFMYNANLMPNRYEKLK